MACPYNELSRFVKLKIWLDELYECYNSKEFVHPDPVELLYDYEDIREREIAALVAAALAYGRASQIVKNAAKILKVMGESPREFVLSQPVDSLRNAFRSFKYRFTDGKSIATLLVGVRGIIREFGSLECCFAYPHDSEFPGVKEAMINFYEKLQKHAASNLNSVLPDPRKNSACKRLYLFLKWMVRKDAIDPGGWKVISSNELIYPLDTHMFSIARSLKATTRKSADFKAAVEVTDFFKRVNPQDPLKYDFVLTRFGIRPDLDKKKLLDLCVENRA